MFNPDFKTWYNKLKKKIEWLRLLAEGHKWLYSYHIPCINVHLLEHIKKDHTIAKVYLLP